jgi:HAE1 family hydrophobic/amphiphilic exporter-1
MTLAALAILGIVAYTRLPAELNPRVDIPTLTIVTVYPGAGPQEIETLITRPLEDAVSTVSGVKDVFSSSQESVSIISMDFIVGTDLDRALSDVREKVDAARALLPPDTQPPTVAKLDINAQPVLYLGLSSSVPLRQLREVIDQKIKPRLARVPGVASVSVVGGEQREVHVAVEIARLEQYGLTIEDVVNALKAANQNIPVGNIVQGRRDIGVRSLNAFTQLEDIRQTQILAPQLLAMGLSLPGMPPPAPSTPITVGDVATVTETTAPPSSLTRVNGKESVALLVTRTPDANTVHVVEGVKAALNALKTELPPDTQMAVSRDESITVREALADVNMTLLLGAILAMTVVFLFLHNLRGTLIVAIALPACFVVTYLVMYFSGFSLNQMTLLALSLSVGILIDDSIVVLESITRHLGMGEDPEEAAYNGRTEIGFAGIALTLTDVVVFLPIAFMGGIVGAFFRQFGLTVAVATLFSLVVSFTVTPSLASRWYRRGENPESGQGFFAPLERTYRRIEQFYRILILRALANRGWVIAAAFTALVAVVLVATPSLGFEFLPAADQGQITITAELPPGSSLAATDAITRQMEQRIAQIPNVQNYMTTVGEILGGFGAIPQRGPQYAQINVRLRERARLEDRLRYFGGVPANMRTRSDGEIAGELRRSLQEIPGARITVAPVRAVTNVGPAIQLQLRGPDLDALRSAAVQVRERMAQMPGILDPDISLRIGRPELQVRIDRTLASALHVPPAKAGAILRDSIEGNTETTFRQAGIEYPIRVQLANLDRNEPEKLRRIPIGFRGGRVVTLGEVAEFRMGAGPAAIERVNGQRMVTVTANLAPNYPLGNAEADIRAQMADIPMQGIEVYFSGEAEAMAENIPYFILALGLAVVLVYLVMASLFNSLLNPFIIMFTLPMALVGALGALVTTGETFSLVSMIGVIMLIGLMGRNAILLVDYTGTLRARGIAREEAVAQAGATRLRPILMTTLATIFGMLPVALRIGRASELRAPMAIVVIGGLLVSTVLTLVVIPALYTLFDDWQAKGMRGRMTRKAKAFDEDSKYPKSTTPRG